MTLIVKCPTCGKPVAWSPSERFRPFCSERCRLIDLGEWATESYAIPVAPAEDESADPPFPRESL
ncbi:MAG: DNA gyrase inhibitor YacG [Methylococcus sp.]